MNKRKRERSREVRELTPDNDDDLSLCLNGARHKA